MKRNVCAALTVCSWALSGALSVGAQEAVDLDAVVVTASRMAQHDYKIAGNISVITQEDIEASSAVTIPDILKEQLGVQVYDNGTAKSSVLDIRGFGDTATRNVLVLVNDRKVNSIDISGPDLLRLPLESVERIEIIRGAGSVLYGDNAVGGVVNIITKQGKGAMTGRVGHANGSYNTSSTDTELSGSKAFTALGVDNEVSYYLYSRYFDTDGYRTNSNTLAKDYNARLGYKISEKVSVDLNAGWHDDDQRLPGGLQTSEIATLGRRGSADPDDYSSTSDRYVQLSFDVSPWPDDADYGHLVLDLYHRNRDVYDAFFTFGENSTKRRIDTNGVTAKYVFTRPVGERDVNLVTGWDYYENENDIRGSGSNVDDLTISKDEVGLFSYLEVEALEDLYLNTGTRYQEARYTFTQRNVVVNEEQAPKEWVSMGGLRYEYAKGSNVHANVQQTFRFLSTDEWYNSANFPDFGITPGLNTDIDQQTGIQYEAGIKHSLGDVAQVTLTPYWIDLNNEIYFDPVGFTNSNYDKTRRTGVEAGHRIDLHTWLGQEWLSKLEIFNNYTFQRPKFREGSNDGKDIPFAARHQASHGLIVGVKDRYNVSFIGRYVGSRFAINDTLNATDPAKPYYTMDIKLSYERPLWDAYVGVNNVFDEKYNTYVSKSAFSSAKDYFPAPERNVLVGMNVRF